MSKRRRTDIRLSDLFSWKALAIAATVAFLVGCILVSAAYTACSNIIDLKSHGVVGAALVKSKEESAKNPTYWFNVALPGDGEPQAHIDVTQREYERTGIGDLVKVVYLTSDHSVMHGWPVTRETVRDVQLFWGGSLVFYLLMVIAVPNGLVFALRSSLAEFERKFATRPLSTIGKRLNRRHHQ